MHLQIFMFVGVAVIEILLSTGREAEDEHGKSVKDIHKYVLHFDVGRSQIELILKVKIEISVCIYRFNAKITIAIPIIESTTVLSDIILTRLSSPQSLAKIRAKRQCKTQWHIIVQVKINQVFIL